MFFHGFVFIYITFTSNLLGFGMLRVPGQVPIEVDICGYFRSLAGQLLNLPWIPWMPGKITGKSLGPLVLSSCNQSPSSPAAAGASRISSTLWSARRAVTRDAWSETHRLNKHMHGKQLESLWKDAHEMPWCTMIWYTFMSHHYIIYIYMYILLFT